ncbi:MAG: protein kinase family protein [Sporichthyaceae bacterium]|nr:protein kinase family protein [Sporichthyaceae bacterium]
MEPVTVEVGRRIARRYRLDERLVDTDGVQTWRAFDEVLARPVGVHVIPGSHPRAQAVVAAAQAASRGFDERFLRVLDAAEDGELIYVTQEWIIGRSLRTVLAEAGPLEPPQAQALITEVAEAIADAHLAGLSHLVLSPESVIFGRGGEVKIAGLSVEAALHGVSSADPAATDAMALGAVLFAALTARWPDHDGYGLSGVPRDGGRLPSPRQVRAGVPAPLDEIVDRSLNEQPRHHMVTLTSPAAFVSALRSLPKPMVRRPGAAIGSMGPAGAMGSMGPPGPVGLPAQHTSDTQVHSRYLEPGEADWAGPSRGMRAVRTLVTFVIVGGLLLLGVLLAMTAIDRNGQRGGGDDPTTPAATAGPLTVAEAHDYDPEDGCISCDAEERPELIPRLIDGDPETAWSSFYYNDPTLPPFKPGIGFVLDLGSVQQVGSVTVTMVLPGVTAELRALPADASSVPGLDGAAGNADDFTAVVGPSEQADPSFTLTPESPVETRYLLVWYTKLPVDPDDDRDRGRALVGEVTVNG